MSKPIYEYRLTSLTNLPSLHLFSEIKVMGSRERYVPFLEEQRERGSGFLWSLAKLDEDSRAHCFFFFFKYYIIIAAAQPSIIFQTILEPLTFLVLSITCLNFSDVRNGFEKLYTTAATLVIHQLSSIHSAAAIVQQY